MGVAARIDHSGFPRQGSHLGRRVSVTFHYDARHVIGGVVVRDDDEPPDVLPESQPLTVIRLDDGRHVLSTECQYSLADY